MCGRFRSLALAALAAGVAQGALAAEAFERHQTPESFRGGAAEEQLQRRGRAGVTVLPPGHQQQLAVQVGVCYSVVRVSLTAARRAGERRSYCTAPH